MPGIVLGLGDHGEASRSRLCHYGGYSVVKKKQMMTRLSGDLGEESGAQARRGLALLVHREAAQQSAG